MTSPHEREKLMRQFRHEPAYALAIALKCAAALLIMILVAVIGVHTHLHSDVMADRPDVRRHDSAMAGDSRQILNERQAPIALHEGVGDRQRQQRVRTSPTEPRSRRSSKRNGDP